MNKDLSIYESHLLKMQDHEVEILWIKGKAFLIRPASIDDIERVAKGFFCMD